VRTRERRRGKGPCFAAAAAAARRFAATALERGNRVPACLCAQLSCPYTFVSTILFGWRLGPAAAAVAQREERLQGEGEAAGSDAPRGREGGREACTKARDPSSLDCLSFICLWSAQSSHFPRQDRRWGSLLGGARAGCGCPRRLARCLLLAIVQKGSVQAQAGSDLCHPCPAALQSDRAWKGKGAVCGAWREAFLPGATCQLAAGAAGAGGARCCRAAAAALNCNAATMAAAWRRRQSRRHSGAGALASACTGRVGFRGGRSASGAVSIGSCRGSRGGGDCSSSRSGDGGGGGGSG
jgi:hypothetical protein